MDQASPNYPGQRNDLGLWDSFLYGGATFLFVLAAFFLLNYFNILSLSEVFPKAFGWLPHQGRIKSALPTTPASGSSSNSPVKSAVIYYRIEGTIKNVAVHGPDFDVEINEQTDRSLPSKLTGTVGRTVIRQYGSDTAIALKGLKPGDKIELLYTQDINTGGSIITQIAVHK